MNRTPLQLAKWTMLAGSAVMIFIVCLPNPRPSDAWVAAQTDRFPTPPVLEPTSSPELRREIPVMVAEAPIVREERQPSETPAEPESRTPYRTAQLPERTEIGDGPPRGIRIENPIFFPEDEFPSDPGLTPDPTHLDPPILAKPPELLPPTIY